MRARYLFVALCALSSVYSEESIHKNKTMESIDNSAKGRVLLLIDVSASLQLKSRKYKLRAALAQWIENYAPDGIILSIVKFSCRAKELHGPTILNSKSRKGLIHILPIRSEGESCIYHGIQKAIETYLVDDGVYILHSKPLPALSLTEETSLYCLKVASPGTVIVTMTNGDVSETKEEIHAVKELVRNAHMTSITIVLGNVMKDGLQEIGTTYQVQDKYGVPGLINALQNALHSSLSSVSPPVVLLEAELMYMERMSGIFQVDSTTSANLCMSISFWPGSTDVSIKLTRPDGLSYPTQLAEQYYHNCSSNRMAGKWKLDVVSESEATFMAALITAESYQNDKSIKFHCSINNDADPPSMYAVLQQGKLPVRGANVTAELWFVDGTVSNFALFDNGLGSDTLVGDGVYSRYILPHLHRTGWYSALCRATGNVTTGNQSLGESITRIARTELTKIVTKESFYPPVSITDLRVTYNDSSLILHFTSPGAELDWGQAAEYHLLVANSTHEILTALPKALETTPKEVNNMERIAIPVPALSYLALRVKGRTGLLSNISNIIKVISPDYNNNGNIWTVKNIETGEELVETITTTDDTSDTKSQTKVEHGNGTSTMTEEQSVSITIIVVIISLISILLVLLIVGALLLRRNREAKYKVMSLNTTRRLLINKDLRIIPD